MAEYEAMLGHDVLQAILAHLPIGLMVIDLNGTVRSWNPAAQAILEKQFGWMGTEACDVRSLPGEIRTGIEYLWEVCRRGASQSSPFSLTLTTPDLYLHFSLLFLDDDDGSRESKKSHVVIVLKGSEPSVTRLWESQAHLTPREEEVLQWLAKGKSRKEISSMLKVSEATVRTHLENLYLKLGVTNRMEAASAALQKQLTESLTATLLLS